jgi:phosphatidyl-myo-inositol dimannoside synthase
MNSLSSVSMAGIEHKPPAEGAQLLSPPARLDAERDVSACTRVLLLTDSFPPHAGGSREYYFNIFRELVALGESEVTILTKKVPGWEEFDRAASSTKFRIIRRFKPLVDLKLKELPRGVFPFLHTLWRIAQERPEVIHAGDLYPQGFIALFAKKAFGIPYVVYCHGEEVTQMDRYRYQPRVRDLIYRSADAVVANSDFACSLLCRIGVAKERIHKINPGVDAARFAPTGKSKTLRRDYGLEGKRIILTVARLVPRKGHRAALEAFAEVSREFPDAHYVIVGTGPEAERLKQLARDRGLEASVTFAGFVPAEKLPEFYGFCDLMLLANREEADGDVEGFGIVFLEANAAGKPVIGGRTGGAVEAVQDEVTGLLVDPDDPGRLTAALRRLLSNAELRERLGRAGLQRVNLEFNWRSKALALAAVNLQILHGGHSHSSLPAEENPDCKKAPTHLEGHSDGTVNRKSS